MPLILKKSVRKNRFISHTKKNSSNIIKRQIKNSLFQNLIHNTKIFFQKIRFRNFAKIFFIAVGVGIIGTLILTLSFWIYGKAITSDFFATKHIDIIGNTRLTKEMVLQFGGIKEGDNSLSASIAKIEQNLHSTPWVEEVSVKRLLPDRFIIKLKERMPSFWIQKDGILYYANDKGEIIAPVESSNFLSLPTLTIEPGGEETCIYLPRLLKEIHNNTLPIEAGAIAAVEVSPARGIELFIEDRDMRLSISTEEWEGNLERIGLALGDLAKRHELGNVRELRVVDGNVWVIRNGK